MVGALKVKCVHGEGDMIGGSRSRRRGNDGEAVIDSCGWTGECKDIRNHEGECQFKVIECTLEGCNHECRRKDMNDHLSGDGFIRHMNLMQQSITKNYDKKVNDMQSKLHTTYEKKMRDMQGQLQSDYEKKMRDMQGKLQSDYDGKLQISNEKIKSLQKRIVDLESTAIHDGNPSGRFFLLVRRAVSQESTVFTKNTERMMALLCILNQVSG